MLSLREWAVKWGPHLQSPSFFKGGGPAIIKGCRITRSSKFWSPFDGGVILNDIDYLLSPGFRRVQDT